MIIYRNEHAKIRSRSDFRFAILDKRMLGNLIFPDESNNAPIKYKGKIIALGSFQCVNKKHFFLFGRFDYKIHGQNPFVPISNFRADLNTKCLDINHDWIYTGDYITRLKDDKIYEVMICPQSGKFYLKLYDQLVSYNTSNMPLTDNEDYSIIGNNVEGIINATWSLHE